MVDEDGDGVISTGEKREEAIFDLKFLSQRDNGIIWTKAHPTRFIDRDRDLGVIVENYVDSLGGTGLYAEGSLFGVRQTKERTFTTIVRERRSLVVDRHPAVEIVVEIFESEKLKADPNGRREKVHVIFTRFGYVDGVGSKDEADGWPVRAGKASRYEVMRQAILVIGYANTTDAFDASTAVFRDFVARVTLPDSDPSSLPAVGPVPPVGPSASVAPAAAVAAPPSSPGGPRPAP